MELKEFIKNVIIDISSAIEESQDVLSQKACVAPLIIGGNKTTHIQTAHGYAKISTIDFDVAVTTESSDSSTTGVGGGIKVLDVIKFGGDNGGESKTLSQSISRVKFSIPLVYPHSRPVFQVNRELAPPLIPCD